jgi:integral membrane sensor domain MASE1
MRVLSGHHVDRTEYDNFVRQVVTTSIEQGKWIERLKLTILFLGVILASNIATLTYICMHLPK